ncbi:AI-2E family transporter [Hyphomicrobiaceae bacterium 22]|uniref:AI-2E family transporter n=1 Tax=Prosthecodimorpha staleyi TaxID=2840188 RepID=A0A947D9H7_9HYPH|nr:AI-2E family transporter [Prosthecodimorpha staleyi]
MLALLVALRSASAIAVPMVAAIVLGSVLAHIGDRAQRIGVPTVVAGMVLVLATSVGLFVLGNSVADAISSILDRLPDLTKRVEALLGPVIGYFDGLHALMAERSTQTGGEGAGSLGRLASSVDMTAVTGFLGGLTPAFGEVLVFLATLAFFVAGRAALRRKAILAFGDRDRRLAMIRVFNAAEATLATYFGTTSTIYLAVGIMTGAIAWSSGLANPALWGVIAFLLSFIPFLGPAIITVALVSAGLLTHTGLLAALWPAIGFGIVHLISENAILPSILGRRFEINPFLVFVAIVFWSWMWGPMGAALAVPILLVAQTMRDALAGAPLSSLPE